MREAQEGKVNIYGGQRFHGYWIQTGVLDSAIFSEMEEDMLTLVPVVGMKRRSMWTALATCHFFVQKVGEETKGLVNTDVILANTDDGERSGNKRNSGGK